MVLKRVTRGWRISRYVVYRETMVDFKTFFWSFIGAFLGIGLIAFLQSLLFRQLDNVFLIGSFGASSVLVYGACQSPLAQPRNLLGGHVVSALLGVSIGRFVPDIIWLSAPLAVAGSIVLMQLTKTLHPPGGATALIAVIGGDRIQALGYGYVVFPVFTGALILLVVAIVFNNMSGLYRYPVGNGIKRMRWMRNYFRRYS
ncbi:HPP family protein [Breznakibacter xylanolyticus]|uniref:HPP family protein n=1 Tax=Breznakibacter xylanolyticus TaxID=990 RepID=A0A2W7N0U5_9BACT|nr:HPP family protein [Breznakibacter xylanolyticus]PZX13591.1 HPP family protein [Breznakibacter xylanolyticus]